MKAFINHLLFEIKTGIRNKTLLIMNYLLPMGFFLMMGFVMGGIMPEFLNTMIPAIIVFAILSATFLGIPDPLVNAREKGIFRSYKINGIPAVSILIISILTTMVHLVITAVVITVAAPLLFDAELPVSWFHFCIVFLAMAFACAGLSVLIGVISPNSRATVLWSQLFFIPSNLLGGMMIPYNLLPDVAKKAAQILPPTHAMNAFKGLAMGYVSDYSPWASVVILVASGVLAFILAVFLFNWDNHNNPKRKFYPMALLALLPYLIGIFVLT